MNRIAKIALVGGLVTILIGFLYDTLFAGIPYQDPTPALQQRYDFHRSVAIALEGAGMLMVLWSGVLWLGRQLCRAMSRSARPAIRAQSKTSRSDPDDGP